MRELWAYRELLLFLAWRDVKVRYKQTLLGVVWAVLQPTLGMVVFTLFFGRLAGLPSDGVPYALFAFAGLVPWTYFSVSVGLSANSVVADQPLVTKVYFPRILIPTAPMLAGLVDLVIATGVLFAIMAAYGFAPPATALLLPAFFALATATGLGVGYWLASLNVRYRDIKYVVPFLLQLWLFASPIAYAGSLVHGPWRTLYGLNPVVGVVDGVRWALLGTPLAGPALALSWASAALLLITGFVYFRRTERAFADVI